MRYFIVSIYFSICLAGWRFPLIRFRFPKHDLIFFGTTFQRVNFIVPVSFFKPM
jgi:hypothetical protein